MKRDGNRELVTVMVTICADGTKLKEWIIFKGKNFQERWQERNVNDIRMTCTETGYTNNKLGFPWMQDFHQQTIDKSHRRRILLLDGHASHCTPEALDFARSVNIDVVSYPPHTTHETQGLDKVGFGAFKKILAKIRAEWERTNGKVTKETFVVLYEKAAALAFTEKTVKACFSSTGVWSFDPSAIPESATAPALESSVVGSFPLQMSTPVKAAVSAIRALQESRTQEMEGESSTTEDRLEIAGVGAPHTPTRPTLPCPTPGLSPAPSTPHRTSTPLRQQSITQSARDSRLLHTTSIRYVLSVSPLKSQSQLPMPAIQRIPVPARPDFTAALKPSSTPTLEEKDAEIARLREAVKRSEEYVTVLEDANQNANAQLVLASVHNDGLVSKLYHKQTKSTNTTILSNAEDIRIRTSTNFTTAREDQAAEKLRIEAEKAKAKKEKEAAAELRKEAEDWKKEEIAGRRKQREEDLARWEEARKRAKEQGVKPLPPKPKAPVPAPIPERYRSILCKKNGAVQEQRDEEELLVGEDGGDRD